MGQYVDPSEVIPSGGGYVDAADVTPYAAPAHAGMTHTQSSSPRAPRKPSEWGDIPQGIYSGLTDFGSAVKQRYYEATGNPQAAVMQKGVADARAAAVAAENAQYKAPSFAMDVSQFVGQALPSTALGFALGPSIPAAAATGAFAGLTSPSASNAETALNTGLGAGAGAVMGGMTKFFLPAGSTQPEHQAAIAAAQREGLPLFGGAIGNRPIVQRSEAHAIWNPLTSTHATKMVEAQADATARNILQRTGVPAEQIPKKAALTPELLQKADDAIGGVYTQAFPPGKIIDMYAYSPSSISQIANSKVLVGDGEKVVNETVASVNKTLAANNYQLPSEALQDTLRMVNEQIGKANTAGDHRAAEVIKQIWDHLSTAVPDQAAHNRANLMWAQLKTSEDALRRSKRMGEGNINPALLAKAVERNMPGGVLYNRSEMADLARGAEQMAGLGALPDRTSGWLQGGDLRNAATYYRFNNPLAKWSMLNTPDRDALDMTLRGAPYLAYANRKNSKD